MGTVFSSRKETARGFPILRLYHEQRDCALTVFRFLNVRDHTRLALTCHTMYRASNLPSPWNRVPNPYGNSLPWNKTIDYDEALQRAPNDIQSFICAPLVWRRMLSFSRPTNMAKLYAEAEKGRFNVRSVVFAGVNFSVPSLVKRFGDVTRDWVRVVFYKCTLHVEDIKALSDAKGHCIEELEFESCFLQEKRILFNLQRLFPRLHTLSMTTAGIHTEMPYIVKHTGIKNLALAILEPWLDISDSIMQQVCLMNLTSLIIKGVDLDGMVLPVNIDRRWPLARIHLINCATSTPGEIFKTLLRVRTIRRIEFTNTRLPPRKLINAQINKGYIDAECVEDALGVARFKILVCPHSTVVYA